MRFTSKDFITMINPGRSFSQQVTKAQHPQPAININKTPTIRDITEKQGWGFIP